MASVGSFMIVKKLGEDLTRDLEHNLNDILMEVEKLLRILDCKVVTMWLQSYRQLVEKPRS